MEGGAVVIRRAVIFAFCMLVAGTSATMVVGGLGLSHTLLGHAVALLVGMLCGWASIEIERGRE